MISGQTQNPGPPSQPTHPWRPHYYFTQSASQCRWDLSSHPQCVAPTWEKHCCHYVPDCCLRWRVREWTHTTDISGIVHKYSNKKHTNTRLFTNTCPLSCKCIQRNLISGTKPSHPRLGNTACNGFSWGKKKKKIHTEALCSIQLSTVAQQVGCEVRTVVTTWPGCLCQAAKPPGDWLPLLFHKKVCAASNISAHTRGEVFAYLISLTAPLFCYGVFTLWVGCCVLDIFEKSVGYLIQGLSQSLNYVRLFEEVFLCGKRNTINSQDVLMLKRSKKGQITIQHWLLKNDQQAWRKCTSIFFITGFCQSQAWLLMELSGSDASGMFWLIIEEVIEWNLAKAIGYQLSAFRGVKVNCPGHKWRKPDLWGKVWLNTDFRWNHKEQDVLDVSTVLQGKHII